MHALLLALAFAAPPEAPKAKSPLDDMIASALKNHPDVRAAEAKKLLAEAELEQARLVITQKVATAMNKVEVTKAKLTQAMEEAAIADKILQDAHVMSMAEKSQYVKARPALNAVKAELAAAELELQLLVGKGGNELKPADKPEATKREEFAGKMPTGPAIDKLELVVRRQVVLNLKNVSLVDAITSIVGPADSTEILVRGRKDPANPITVTYKTPMSFEAAVELLLDEYNAANIGKELAVYVREYGLLIEHPRGPVPKDAIPLSEFIQVVKAKKK